jgi:hypothetical protein
MMGLAKTDAPPPTDTEVEAMLENACGEIPEMRVWWTPTCAGCSSPY